MPALRLVEPGEKPISDQEALDAFTQALDRYIEFGCPGGLPDASMAALRLIRRSLDRLEPAEVS